MVKEIVWSRRALIDRFQILEYWINRNKSSRFSEKLDKLFLQKIELLSLHPFIGKTTTSKGIRVKIVRDYLIFYEILDTEIHILSIKDGRLNPKKFKNIP
jgi:addiction module RelE/StbE family toxin